MATPQQNAAAIVAQAAQLDGLIAQFRTIKTDIEARELEIRRAFPGRVAKAGQERMALYAHSLMVEPSIAGKASTEALASSAWSELL